MYRYLIPLCLILLSLTGCFDKKDCNGDLDGMWQLLEWRDAQGVVRANKDSMVYYSFQLQMAKFDKRSQSERFSIKSSLEVSPQSLRIYNPIVYVGNGHDSIQSMASLAPAGVPADGLMHIHTLTSSRMVLTTTQADTLWFRKY